MQDTARYDSLHERPLPKWLTDQRDGLNTLQPPKMVMQEDKSLTISLVSTGVIILIIVVFLTTYFLRKNKKRKII